MSRVEQGAQGFSPADPGTPESLWLSSLWTTGTRRGPVELLAGHDDLVVLAAHPDDETLAAGGLLAAAADRRLPTTLVVATSGEASHPQSTTHTPEQLAGIREAEVRRALDHVNPAARLVLLRLPDTGLAAHQAPLVAALTEVVGPRTLLVAPWHRDGHADHDAAGAVAALVAADTGAQLLEYPVWLWHWGGPDQLLDEDLICLGLDASLRQRKAAALDCHPSQTAPLSQEPGDETLIPEHVLTHFLRPFEVFVRSHAGSPDPGDLEDADAANRGGDEAFDEMFAESDDPWGFETSWYERRKRAVTLGVLPQQDLGRVLEVGCSTGVLTAELAARATTVLATDISPEAVRRARHRLRRQPWVSVTRLRAPQQWPEGEFELVVLSEIGYFWEPDELKEALRLAVGSLAEGGLLLLCHWRHAVTGWSLDGDAVHAAALDLPDVEVVVSHVEEDFRVDLLAAPHRQSPARREGLT